MKLDKDKKSEKQALIDNDLVSRMHEISVTNVADIRKSQMQDLITQIDQFDQNEGKLEVRLDALRNHTSMLEDNMPFLDDQIKFLKEEMEKMNDFEVTAEKIVDETYVPKDELSQRICKYDAKVNSIQDIITNGLTGVDFDDLETQLQHVRKISNKQFSALWKRNQLVEHQKAMSLTNMSGINP